MASPRPRVGFATDGEHGDFTPDDEIGVAALARHDIEAVSVVWSRPLPSDLGAVVLRSTWDYHLQLPAFLEWLHSTESQGIPLWNPAGTVRRNVDKRYLGQLQERGIPVVPTRYVVRGVRVTLRQLLDEERWSTAVVKPAVSGGAWNTWKTTGAAEDDRRFSDQLALGDCLVQPFVREILDAGEWSLLFFDGRFSHAVLKRVAGGDFRVQEEYGGTHTPKDPSPALVAQAARALAAANERTLYARVDGVEREGQFRLLELELVEPTLFLGASPAAADRFAVAVSSWLAEAARVRSG